MSVKSLNISSVYLPFSNWLKTLGYSDSTLQQAPKALQHLQQHLEQHDCFTTNAITQQLVSGYIEHLQTKKSDRTKTGLSIAHINKQITLLNLFFEYIIHSNYTGKTIRLLCQRSDHNKNVQVLSQEQIDSLYTACTTCFLGWRNTILLHVYYGCGLRKSEGLRLKTEDIDLINNYIEVKQSKTGKSRRVPITSQSVIDFTHYIHEIRPYYCDEKLAAGALFISIKGKSMSKEMMYLAFKNLCKKAEVSTSGLHVLRHSIATHLLQKGMSLDDIGKFLGHSSMDSTQIYTHIVNEL